MDNSNTCLYMRMCVLLRWPSMRCPARVAYADVSFERVAMNLFFQINKFANASAHIHLFSSVDDGNSRGVISPVFKTLEPVKQYAACVFSSYVADYSTHSKFVAEYQSIIEL